jgi:hypothetical protein
LLRSQLCGSGFAAFQPTEPTQRNGRRVLFWFFGCHINLSTDVCTTLPKHRQVNESGKHHLYIITILAPTNAVKP